MAMSAANQRDIQFIKRCFELAQRGIGNVSPNPPVGAVLVHEDRIIGEGFHPFYGGLHAEVQTINSVKDEDRHLIPLSTLYVSLEPCCIYGKTPPCTDLILREKIEDVRISTLDPNPKMAGNGIALLKANGINITSGILEKEGKELIRMFRNNILFQKPYVILKWAQSERLYIGSKDQRILLSHPYTLTCTHNLRSMADDIIVSARTVLTDNPMLTVREASGRSPHRAIYDPNTILNNTYKVFNEDGHKIFYYSSKENTALNLEHIIRFHLTDTSSHAEQMLTHLFNQKIGILLVEGGSYLLNEFIKENLWDEAWVIQTSHPLDTGIKAPVIKGRLLEKIESATDTIIGIANDQKEKMN